MDNDISILRDLAHKLKAAGMDPKQDEKRALWKTHHDLKKTKVPIIVYMGAWDALGSEILNEDSIKCTDPIYREAEFKLRKALFKYEVDDDEVIEPWITMGPYFLSSGCSVFITMSVTRT